MDYQRLFEGSERVLLLWDAHGFEIAEMVLGRILPLIADRPHLYRDLGEVLPRSVRGKQLDVERLEASRKDRDSVPRRDREQRSHPQSLHVVPGILGPMASGAPPRSSES